MKLSEIRAVVFDVLGTVVDEDGTVHRATQELFAAAALPVEELSSFLDEWERRQRDRMDAIRRLFSLASSAGVAYPSKATADGATLAWRLSCLPGRTLLAQLPLELSFADYGGQEKIAGIPMPLALDGMPPGGSAEPGTIGYYAPDQALVLYYDSVGYYNGIIPLGTFDDVATVQNAPAFVGTVTAGGAE